MTQTIMTAAVCYAAGDLRYEQVPTPQPAAGEVLVRIAYCGICPSDLRVYDGRSAQKLPLILGHEFTGWIEQVGADVTRLQVGDRVVVNPAQPCYTRCPACLRGIPNKCSHMQAGGGGGGLGQFRIAKESAALRLKPGTDMLAASFAEPLACVLHGQKRAHIRPGGLVVVVGCGPIGLLHLLCARLAGARVLVAEPHPARLAHAVRLGADVAVDPTQQDLAEIVRSESDGWGADAVIVAVGNKAASEGAVRLLGIQGTLVLFAGTYPNLPLQLDSNLVHYSEINITGSSDYSHAEFLESVSFIERKLVDTAQLVSHVLPFDQITHGMQIVRQGTSLKVVIEVNRPLSV